MYVPFRFFFSKNSALCLFHQLSDTPTSRTAAHFTCSIGIHSPAGSFENSACSQRPNAGPFWLFGPLAPPTAVFEVSVPSNSRQLGFVAAITAPLRSSAPISTFSVTKRQEPPGCSGKFTFT